MQLERLGKHRPFLECLQIPSNFPALYRPVIFEFVQKLLASAASFHHILLERSVTGLLRLASCAARQVCLNDSKHEYNRPTDN